MDVVAEVAHRLRALPPPVVVRREGLPETRVDVATAASRATVTECRRQSSVTEVVERVAPGFTALAERAWTEMRQSSEELSGTTFLRKSLDGRAGGGTTVCGLLTRGLSAIMPGAYDHPEWQNSGMLSAADMADWLEECYEGVAGATSNELWDVTVELAVREHPLPGCLQTEHVAMSITIDPTMSAETGEVVLWFEANRKQAVLLDVSVYKPVVHPGKICALHAGVDAVLAGVHRCLLLGVWLPNTASVICSGYPAKQLARSTGWDNGADTHHAYGDTATPPDAILQQPVDVAYCSMSTGVCYGRIAAGDVPPALHVVTALNGGKDISMSTLCVNSNGLPTMHTYTDVHTIYKVEYLHTLPKRAPCVRDGLLSPGLLSALRGDGSGQVGITLIVNGIREELEVDTRWSDLYVKLQAGGHVDTEVMYSLDVASTLRALMAYGQMQGWDVVYDEASSTVTATVGRAAKLTIEVRYGASSVVRWAQPLSKSFMPDYADVNGLTTDRVMTSELGLDYWCSGLARYLARHYVVAGRMRQGVAVEYNEGYLFNVVRHTPRPSYRSKQPVDFVVDLERLNKKIDGAGYSYIYAIGIARIEGGALTGSTLIVDDNPSLPEMVRGSSLNQAHRDNATRLIANQEYQRGDAGQALARLRQLYERESHVRIFGKGVDSDDAAFQGDHMVATRLFKTRRVLPNKRKLRELGSLMGKVEVIAERVGWPQVHNPAIEAVLFSYAAGMLQRLPTVGDVGLSTIDEILKM